MKTTRLSTIALICVAAASISCGGGGGSTSGGSTSQPVQNSTPLTITTTSILPPTVQGHSYSTTLTAVNGQGVLHWSIAPVSSTALFVNGLSIDANTGVLSGTANFGGTAGFIATVTDSASPAHGASSNFFVTAYLPLTSAASQTASIFEFQQPFIRTGLTGGVPPISYSVTSGNIPPGVRFDNTGQLTGAPYATGTYQFTLTAQDSFSPPETATQPFTITVTPPSLSVMNSLPPRLAINEPFNGKIIAVGGLSPYKFAVFGGFSLPPGLSLDPGTGIVSGIPTKAGSYFFSIQATDSSPAPQTTFNGFNLTVGAALGRNDTPATATLIDNGFYSASISPYIDPPNGPPLPADHDYYKLFSVGGAIVHVETSAKRNNPNNPLDTVIEIVDGNGIRLNTCRQPGDTSATFAGACINDDISASPHIQDSALDFQVPGARNTATTFYVHVFDWRGDARPDMTYSLQVNGVVHPLVINSLVLPAATRGLSYSQQLLSTNGLAPISWSVISGSLPPGLTLNSIGLISGAATTDGTYPFTVQASDSGNPPQTASAQAQIQVGEPVKITSPAIWPDACLNQPYSFTVQTSGGVPPLHFGAIGGPWPLFDFDQSAGTFSGTPTQAGTFTVQVSVIDATNHGDFQNVSLTVKQCP